MKGSIVVKIKGEVIGGPKPVDIVINRGDKNFVFTIKAVLKDDSFDAMVPEVKPVIEMKPGTTERKPLFDEAYRQRMTKYWELRAAWMVLEALSATEGLVWEKVKMTDPDTWLNYTTELEDAGLTSGEISYLITKVNEMNSVDEKKMQEALDRFRALQAAENEK